MSSVQPTSTGGLFGFDAGYNTTYAVNAPEWLYLTLGTLMGGVFGFLFFLVTYGTLKSLLRRLGYIELADMLEF